MHRSLVIATLGLLSLCCPYAIAADELQPKYKRPSNNPTSDEEFFVRMRGKSEDSCVAYGAYNTPDQATILIPWRLLSDLAAPSRAPDKESELSSKRAYQARLLMQRADYSKRNYWGCAPLDKFIGTGEYLIYELLDAGAVVVISDSRSEPSTDIYVKYMAGSKNIISYSLNKKSKPFLTKDPERIERDKLREEFVEPERRNFSMNREPKDERDQHLYGFIRRFIASCRDERQEQKKFHLSNIRLPLKYTFSVVTENGKSVVSSGSVSELKFNSSTGGLALPLCIGDGGLDNVEIRRKGNLAQVDLTFGSGPNELLQFAYQNNEWKLVAAEWIDH
jgi:hypothetical protein